MRQGEGEQDRREARANHRGDDQPQQRHACPATRERSRGFASDLPVVRHFLTTKGTKGTKKMSSSFVSFVVECWRGRSGARYRLGHGDG